MAIDLSGEVALVTGGTRGIGLATAQALAAAGAKVAVTARSGVEEAAAAVGGDALGLVCDVSDPAQAEASVARVIDRFGKLSILVNNAGVIEPIGSVLECDPAEWGRNVTINLTGAYAMARYALPGMVAAGRGFVVNVSSGAAHRPLEGWSAYCSAKAGMTMLTRALHLETHGRGVRTYGLAPGTVDTEMQVKIRASGLNPISQIPREKLGGVDQPAAGIVYLCSDAAGDLAGEELSIYDAALRERIGLPAL
ncbi:MAG: SDR family NAD(P)-dependent oxidoreductase [Alphaproteobacteria bacterium]|nr:SDR family NAD(P)-dependent oxidoreductase [Alphaproteobacteria bacterium]MCB9928148.1 SDR family NAD(P)-dependent oxidoreductase [Alphaproteobacteria bacterium]